MQLTRWLVPMIASAAIACGSSSTDPSTGPSTGASAATVVSVAISGAGGMSAAGQTRQLAATATMSDGTTKDVTSSATWVSSSTGVATVSTSGVVTAVGAGSVTVTVTYQGKTASTSITISITGPLNGTLTATIDGTAFVATTILVGKSQGILAVGGVNGTTGAYSDLTVTFPNVVGTYTLPSTPQVGGSLTINGVGAWNADPGGGSGTVTVTSVTANSAVGTFSFVLGPLTGTGNKTVTNGVFNVTF